MEETSPKPSASGPHLVEQDIHLKRVGVGEAARVTAEVACLRRGCVMNVAGCAHCPHFVRIEPHEAGYLLLCRSGGPIERSAAPVDSDPDAIS